MKKYFMGGLILWAMSMNCFALIQCPGSSNFVNEGDTMQAVIQQCGSPQQTIQQQTQAAIWTYTLMQFNNVGRVGFSLWFTGNSVTAMRTTQGIDKTRINCPSGAIQIGSTPQEVVAACGQPTTIQDVSKQTQQQTGQITHLIYQPQSYMPETTFIFKNGYLVGSQ